MVAFTFKFFVLVCWDKVISRISKEFGTVESDNGELYFIKK
jgi:hypothetical protein